MAREYEFKKVKKSPQERRHSRFVFLIGAVVFLAVVILFALIGVALFRNQRVTF